MICKDRDNKSGSELGFSVWPFHVLFRFGRILLFGQQIKSNNHVKESSILPYLPPQCSTRRTEATERLPRVPYRQPTRGTSIPSKR